MIYDSIKTKLKFLGCTPTQKRTLRLWGFSRRDDHGYTDSNGNRIARYKKLSGSGTAFYHSSIKYCESTGKPVGSSTTFYSSLDELIADVFPHTAAETN